MSTQGNGGILSKFQERLRKIRLSRIRKKRKNEEFVQERVKEIREVLGTNNSKYSMLSKRVIRPIKHDEDSNGLNKTDSITEVIDNIRNTSNDRTYDRRGVGVVDIASVREKDSVRRETVGKVVPFNKSIDLNNEQIKSASKVIDFNVSNASIKEEDELDNIIADVRDNKPKIRKGKRASYVAKGTKKAFKSSSKEERKELLGTLGAEIIEKIKEGFEEKLDELEVLESELYILNQQHKVEVELKKVVEIKKRINELIERINEIIEQYNLYKKNYYIDNVIGLDDNVLVDDIIEYRTLLDSFDDEREFVKEYKALDEFRALYDNLVEIRDETELLQVNNNQKIDEFDIRDKKYDRIKCDMISVLNIDKKCSQEIERQNEYFEKLMAKVNIIDRHEYTTTHLRGFGNFISHSLRYMGLLLISPFTGMTPGISMQTIATRRLVANAYRHLHLEEVNHVYYEAVNHDSEINHHLTDVDYAKDNANAALKDIDRLRDEFMRIYNSNIPGYEKTLRDIGKMEKCVLRSLNKIDIIEKNLKMSKKLNSDKLARVRKMNDEERKRVA